MSLDEVVRILHGRGLSFPIASKADFVAQMTRSGQRVRFLGRSYEVAFAADRIPAFFFPVETEAELVAKVGELLMARGLIPVGPTGHE